MTYEHGDILETDGWGTLYFIEYHNDDEFFGTSDEDECRNSLGHFYPLSIIEGVEGNIFNY